MDKSELTNLIKTLRTALGDTQQMFAHRMHTAIRTVARWETVRPPSDETLAQFLKLANDYGYMDLAEGFKRAISERLGHPVPRFSEDSMFEILPGERSKFEAFARVLRSARYKKQREQVERILAPIETANAKSDLSAMALFGLHGELRKRISAGESDDQIVRGLPAWQPDIVRTLAANQREFDRLSEALRKGEK